MTKVSKVLAAVIAQMPYALDLFASMLEPGQRETILQDLASEHTLQYVKDPSQIESYLRGRLMMDDCFARQIVNHAKDKALEVALGE